MANIIEHCRQNQKSTKVYEIRNYKGYAVLRIYFGEKCKAKGCGHRFYNTLGVDIWGNRVPAEGKYVIKGKQSYEYDRLIETGEAIERKKEDTRNRKETRAGSAGCGEWSLKARGAGGHQYVLRSLKLARSPQIFNKNAKPLKLVLRAN